jgi:hypothetical protein
MTVTYKELLDTFDCSDMRTLGNNLLGSYTVIDADNCLLINNDVKDIINRVRKEGMLNIKAAAKSLGVSDGFIRNICHQNKLTYYGFGKNSNPRLLFYKSTFFKEIQGVNPVIQNSSLDTLGQYNSLVNSIDNLLAEYRLMDDRSIKMLIAYNGGETLENIGLNFGVSRERVRQILDKARNKRHHIVEEALKHFLQVGDEFHYVSRLEYEVESLKKQLEISGKVDLKDRINIEDCDFSVRLYNALRAVNLKTIGDITRYKGNLRQLRNFGKGSMRELREHMKQNYNYDM